MRVKQNWYLETPSCRQYARPVDVNKIGGALSQNAAQNPRTPHHVHAKSEDIRSRLAAVGVAGERKALYCKSKILGNVEQRPHARSQHFRLPAKPAHFRQHISQAELCAAEVAELVEE